MIFFDQFAFAVNEFQNNLSIQIVNRARAHQFQVFQNFFELITSLVANSTRLISKRFLTDIIDTVNQFVQKRFRDKFRKNVNKVTQTVVSSALRVKKVFDKRSNQRNANRAFEVNFTFAFYNSIFSAVVNLQSRQAKRQFARLASRVSLFSQSLFQEENDDHDFDDLSSIRSYADFVDHESNQKFEHVSNIENDEKKKLRLLNRKDKKAYAREIVRQRVRIRRSDLKNRRDDKSLSFDYMIVRKKDVIFAKYELFKF